MASSGGGSLNTSNFNLSSSSSSQFMSASFSDLLAQPNNEEFGSNWGFDTPKPKTLQNSSSILPFSPPPVSPSSYLAFLDSPIQVSSSNVSLFLLNSSFQDYLHFHSQTNSCLFFFFIIHIYNFMLCLCR